MALASSSYVSIQFRTRMNEHHAWYQEQVAVNQEAECQRALAARQARVAARHAWGRMAIEYMAAASIQQLSVRRSARSIEPDQTWS